MDSKDRRTKRQKLEDMASQSASPQEAEIARKKLEALPKENPNEPKIGSVYVNGIKVGEVVDFEIKVRFEQDQGGWYDFVNQRWNWFGASDIKVDKDSFGTSRTYTVSTSNDTTVK